MLLILLFLVFIIYLLKTPELGSDQISYYEKSNYKKPINADFTTIQSDQKFVIGKTN
jgi:hypothetical protein